MNKFRNLAIIALLFEAAAYVSLSIVGRVLDSGFQPMTQVSLRITLAFILSVLVFGKFVDFKNVLKTPKKDWLWLTLMGTLGYSIAVLFLTLGAIHTKLINVSIIYSLVPLVVYTYSLFLLKQKPRWKLLSLVLLSIFGVFMIINDSFVFQGLNFGAGELYMVIAVFLSAWWSVGRKLLSDHLNNKEISIVVLMIASVSGWLITIGKGEVIQLASFYDPNIILALIAGGVLNIILTFTGNFAFQHLDVVFGNQLLLSENIFSIILGYAFYRETITLFELAGSAVILLSVVLANRLLKQTE